ncbi:MAG: S41 family peptidase [Gammaproteobacteria bacterium]|nr:S41 family peptidase [Gammaproteobacteria bacterium]
MFIYRKIILIAALLLGLNFFGVITSYASTSQPTNNNTEGTAISAEDLQRLATVIAEVKKYYYREIDDKTLFTNAISGMLSELDPHSAYLTEQDLKDLQMETTGRFGGLGIEIAPDQGAIKVISPLDDTPAYKAGVKAGDYIIQINNKFVRNMSLNEALNMMRGPKGGLVTLTIVRKNSPKPLIFNLHREMINVKTIKTKMLEPGYYYIRIAIFQEPTERDLTKAISKIKKDSGGHIKGIVLDIRNNPGGLLESAVQIADNFLDSDRLKNNDIIVYTKGQDSETQITAHASSGELLPNVPLVVIVNEGSASAAEILAGALQDHKRAVVVGTRSFGKGSVQTLIPVDKNSAIKLTTALYYTPLGRSIQAKGIEPDITVENFQIPEKKSEVEALERISESSLIDHIQNSDAQNSTENNDTTANSDDERNKAEVAIAYKDYQLYEALHILKSLNVLIHKTNN